MMIRTLAAVAVFAGALGACGMVNFDGQIDAEERKLLDAARAFAVSQVVAFNAAGVDPLNLKPNQLQYAQLGCGLLSAGAAVLAADDPSVAAEVTAWCGVFNQAAQ